MNIVARISVFLCAIAFLCQDLRAQVDLGTDLVSRYVWRGIDLGGGAIAFQPWASLGLGGNVELGVWSSYNVSPTGASDELDWYFTYSIEDFSITVTDYSFPGGGEYDYFDYDNHVLEISGAYSGLIDFMAAVNVINDDDRSLYLEIGKSIEVEGSELGFFAGAVTKSDYYLAPEGGLINLGFSASKEVKITETFSLPLTGTYVVNPELKKSYFFVGLSF